MTFLNRVVKKLIKVSLYLTFILISSLCLFECIYRIQIIDFYKNELEALNPKLNQSYPDGNILIFGDSFSGFPNGYVDRLRKRYPKTNFINCSVSGTGIRQHRLFFESRLKEFQPKKILYQFYVGNDLLDVRQDYNFSKETRLKSLYYFVSDYFLSLKYLNYKLARFKSVDKSYQPNNNIESKEYNSRIKTQFKINPTYLAETIQLEADQIDKLNIWLKYFEELRNKSTVPITLLVIPHALQVNFDYLYNIKSKDIKIEESTYHMNYNLLEELKMRSGVSIADPLPYFRDHVDELYYRNDPHLNEFGQSVLAEFIEYENILYGDKH